MDLSEHERRRLAGIEKSLIVEAPRLQCAFGRWSTRPLRARRVGTTVRAVLIRAVTPVVLSVIVLALGATLMVLGVVQGRPVAAVVGLVVAQFGPWLIARSARPRPGTVLAPEAGPALTHPSGTCWSDDPHHTPGPAPAGPVRSVEERDTE